ncbi:hypothetical protein D3C76_1283640 [compost metagenome]
MAVQVKVMLSGYLIRRLRCIGCHEADGCISISRGVVEGAHVMHKCTGQLAQYRINLLFGSACGHGRAEQGRALRLAWLLIAQQVGVAPGIRCWA